MCGLTNNMLEAALGALVGDPSAAGCAALIARAYFFPGDVSSALLLSVLGSHHFDSWGIGNEVVYVVASLLAGQQTAAEPSAVPPMTEQLCDAEFSGLVSAVVAGLEGAAGAFVAEARRRVAIGRLAGIIAVGETASCERIGVMEELMKRLAKMCRFDRTGDAFLLLTARALLPVASVCTLEDGETPYAISRTDLAGSNDRIGGLFREPPGDLLDRHQRDLMSPVRLSLMMALAAEYLPKIGCAPPLFINSDIGPANTGMPEVYMCIGFDCGEGDTIVVAAGGSKVSYTCATSAVLAWVAADPRCAELHAAVTDPSALEPTSVFSRLGNV